MPANSAPAANEERSIPFPDKADTHKKARIFPIVMPTSSSINVFVFNVRKTIGFAVPFNLPFILL